jgi:predicted RNase H-like nuclease (RuvC/YqgF family)
MAKSKYEFKKLKAKPLKAKVKDSMAVRLLFVMFEKMRKSIAGKMKNVTAYTGQLLDDVRLDRAPEDELKRIKDKIEENKELIDKIKKDESSEKREFKDLVKAQKENKRLIKMLDKMVSLQTKIGTSNIPSIIADGIEENKDKKESLDELTKELATKGVIEQPTPVVNEPVVAEPKVEFTIPVAEEPVTKDAKVEPVTPVVDTPAPSKEESTQLDPLIGNVIAKLNGISQLEAENQKLTGENEKLKQTNANQIETISNLKKENDRLKEIEKTKNLLEQKVTDYQITMDKHAKEFAEMKEELDKLRYSSKENDEKIKKLSIDMQKIVDERNYYKSQFIALANAINYTGTQTPPTQVEEPRVR